jgi:hypothetical protein
MASFSSDLFQFELAVRPTTSWARGSPSSSSPSSRSGPACVPCVASSSRRSCGREPPDQTRGRRAPRPPKAPTPLGARPSSASEDVCRNGDHA